MNKEYLEILTNIIGGVESGGQIYGNRRYEAYAGVGANSANEKTCTLGWAQNYGNTGRKLCKLILEKDATAFRKADSGGIESKLQKDWEATQWNPSTAEKTALIAIITTDAGKECQDELFQELMEAYIVQAEAYGVTEIQAQMMWCEIQHLGGLTPVKRIFGRANKPYTPDTVFASLILDQNDTSNDNQVGDKKYQSRHECCVKWIKQYVSDAAQEEGTDMTEKELRQKYAAIMNGWIGLDRATGTHKVIIDTYNAHTPLARGYKVTYADAYCAATVSAAAIVCGLTAIIPTECGCGQQIALFKALGRWVEDDAYVPNISDIIYYDWDDDGAGDCTGWPEHVGAVTKISGSTLTITEGNMSGKVAQRTIAVNARYIRGYGIPDFASKVSGGSSSSGSSNNTTSWKATGTGTASTDGTKVLASAGGSSLGTLNKGNRFEVDGTLSGNYVHVKVATLGIGYVHKDYVVYDGASESSATTTADSWVKSLQEAIGANQDGIAGSETLSKCPLVKNGSTGTVTKLLQEKLIALGYSCGAAGADGICGAGTVAAIRAYQTAKGLSVDGIVGTNTWSKLLGLS